MQQREVTVSSTDTFAIHRAAMDHYLDVACSVVRANAGALVMTQERSGRTVAHIGLGAGNISFPWNWETSPYKKNKTALLPSQAETRIAKMLALVFGQSQGALFLRVPVCITPEFVLAYVLRILPENGEPSPAELKLVQSVAKIAQPAVNYVAQQLHQTKSPVAIAPTENELDDAVSSWPGLRTLLDAELNIVAISESFASLYKRTPETMKGMSYFEFQTPGMETMSRLYRQSMKSGLSSPIVEVFSNRTGKMMSYNIRATPVQTRDGKHPVLDINIVPTTSLRLDPAILLPENNQINHLDEKGAAESFLFDTLVKKRALRSRGDVTYFTLRNWRSGIKEHQIKALKAIKKDSVQHLGAFVGQECANELKQLVGNKTFKYVVPVPCGHSTPGKCLSTEIARVIAAFMDLPLINAFAHLEQKGSSHPKANLTRPTMRLLQQPSGPTILVDDVATSGAHLAEATSLLRKNGTETISLAWISGDN